MPVGTCRIREVAGPGGEAGAAAAFAIEKLAVLERYRRRCALFMAQLKHCERDMHTLPATAPVWNRRAPSFARKRANPMTTRGGMSDVAEGGLMTACLSPGSEMLCRARRVIKP